jgi:N utilization substance protein B
LGKRRKGREIVLQACYAAAISGAKLDDTLEDQFARRTSAPETVTFARRLMALIRDHRQDLDTKVKSIISKNWNPDRLGALEKVILTMGVAELVYSKDVPVRVVINECLELTRRYCDEEAVPFVNGVLDTAAKKVYPEGIPTLDGHVFEEELPDDGSEETDELDADFGPDKDLH